MRLFVAEIDLGHPGISVRVCPGGPDPDGPGEWEATLAVPTRVAAREGLELVVNGDFFSVRREMQGPTTLPAYRPDVWASAIGPAVTDGRVWSVSKDERPCLVVRKGDRVSIEMVGQPPEEALQVIAGNVMLVRDGKPVPNDNADRHPRTAVGLDKTGRRLVILVVDGRQPGVSIGMSYAELAAEMIRLGCDRAVNLDGGGSSVMAVRDPSGAGLTILNRPSDGRERPVVNVLGIDAAD